VPDTDGAANLRTAYEELCTSYRAIDDFRTKLLGFLPLVTGGGLILLTGRADEVRREFFTPVGLLGAGVTTGLLAYELFGIKKCHNLIKAGQDLECKLGLPVDDRKKPAGQFLRRPNHLLGIVNEPFAAAAIYPAVLAAWLYLAFFLEDPQRGKNVSFGVLLVGFLGILSYDQSLKHEKTLHSLKQKILRYLKRTILRKPQRPLQQAKSPCEADEHTPHLARQIHEKSDETPRRRTMAFGGVRILAAILIFIFVLGLLFYLKSSRYNHWGWFELLLTSWDFSVGLYVISTTWKFLYAQPDEPRRFMEEGRGVVTGDALRAWTISIFLVVTVFLTFLGLTERQQESTWTLTAIIVAVVGSWLAIHAFHAEYYACKYYAKPENSHPPSHPILRVPR
jgi:hypothetical protein